MSLTQRNCSIFENLLLKNKEEIEDLEEVDEYDIKIVNGLLDFEEYLENDGIIIS